MVFCANNAEWTALLWGCAAAGVAFAPINPGLLGRQKELRHIFDILRPSGIATSEATWATHLTTNYKDVLHTDNIKLRMVLGDAEVPIPDDWQQAECLAQADGTSGLDTLYHETDDSGHQSGDLELPSIILSTSGTTSMPKLCCHTNRNVDAQTQHFSAVNYISPASRGVPISPGFHVLATCSAISIWRGGGAIIIPSAQFDAAAIVHVLNTFDPTHIACTPAIVYALAAQPGFSKTGYPSLDNVSIGADQVTEELIKQVADTLRPKKVRNGWGMTEGISILGSFYETEDHPWHNGSQSIGHVLGGSAVKICTPDSTETVTRGTLGELHVSGPAIISGYYAKAEVYQNESFYEADGRSWFKTGDAMVMNSDGWVFMNGRYKDLIIRGGENISPSLIEACLNSLNGVSSQVIGVEDHFSGQAIVAVIKVDTSTTEELNELKEQAQNVVVDELGATFRLTAVYSLSELGFDSFPVTATNKVRKTELRERARELLQGGDKRQTNLVNTDVGSDRNRSVTDILEIWKIILGANMGGLDGTTSVLNLADSLALLRFCFYVEKRFGTRMAPADLFDLETPELQAKFLDSQSRNDLGKSSMKYMKDRSMTEDSIRQDPGVEKILRSHVEEMGYDFETDVEDIYRGIDSVDTFELNTTRPASDNLRFVCQTRHETSIDHLRECVSKCLVDYAAWRSVIVPLEINTTSPKVRHVVMKPSQQWMNTLIKTVNAVNVEELHSMLEDPSKPYAQIGQPTFRAEIFPVNDSQRPGLFMAFNHAVVDAVLLSTFFGDLDALLSGRTADSQCIPYGVFADMYHLHKDGAVGMASKAYQLKKFDQLEAIEPCIWPRSKGPGFLVGDDRGWRHRNGSPGKASERRSQAALPGRLRSEPISCAIDVPSLPALRSQFSIEPFTIVKSAIAIFNVEQTKQNKAVFACCESGRRWPFQEPWVQKQLPNAMNVAGPTLGWAFDFITVEANESVGAMLRRVGEMQRLDTQHCHAPWAAIIDELGPEKGEFVRDMAVRQLLSWDPTTQSRARGESALSNLEPLHRQSSPDHGFFWNMGLESPTRIGGFVLYDDVHTQPAEVEMALERMLEIAEQLAKPENWDNSVGFVQSLE